MIWEGVPGKRGSKGERAELLEGAGDRWAAEGGAVSGAKGKGQETSRM